MKKNFTLILSIVTMLVFFASCAGKDDSGTAEVKKYSLGTSTVGGTFYLVGGGLATTINNALPEKYLFTAETTGGSSANAISLQKGDSELGIAMASVLADSQVGEAAWTGGVVHDNLRGLVALYPSKMTIYSLANSGIETLTDLNGKIVGLGSQGASMDVSLRKVFDLLDIKPASIHNDGHSATAKAVSDGVIDAAIVFSFPPYQAISELETTKELSYVGLTAAEQAAMVEAFPYFAPTNFEVGDYKHITEEIPTVAEWNLLATSNALTEEEGYELTKTLLASVEDMLVISPTAAFMTAENMLNYNIPLHAGAVRYLVEQGFDVPEHLIPAEYVAK